MKSVETRTSWVVAGVALAIMAISYGAPWILVVALKNVAGEMGDMRAVPSLASALGWLGQGVGGILISRVADRIGLRWTVIAGAISICIGLALSTGGQAWQLYLGQGLFIGFLGNGGINAPFYVYISRWFDLHRGSALALISSGSYLAGAMWPPIFERAIAHYGWQDTMFYYGFFEAAVILPLAIIFLKNPPEVMSASLTAGTKADVTKVLGWPPNVVYTLLVMGIFLCCIPMAIPQAHIVAFCSDLGIKSTHGAAMLSVLLGAAFLSRQFWGWVSDRIGGIKTVLLGSICQSTAMVFFLVTQDEVGLFIVAAAFGLGFSGMIPANVLAVRELFPARDASWRIPLLLFLSGSGMATGGWLAGVLYDYFGFYGPAFAVGIAAGMLNLAILGTLVLRARSISTAPVT